MPHASTDRPSPAQAAVGEARAVLEQARRSGPAEALALAAVAAEWRHLAELLARTPGLT